MNGQQKMKMNAQKLLEKKISEIKPSGCMPSLLLHACCAPCSSYVLEYLSEYFKITLLFYNPNITPVTEYEKRYCELERLIKEMPLASMPTLINAEYEPEKFFSIAKGMEGLPEGCERCFACYRLRLENAAQYAAVNKFDYFTTTLSISPHKNADELNKIGSELADKYDVPYLYADFKKNNGYKRSIELSKIYGLYRQNYCGCVFSQRNVNMNNYRRTK